MSERADARDASVEPTARNDVGDRFTPLPRARAERVSEPPPTRTVNIIRIVIWLVIAAPAIYQIGLLVITIGSRFGYPYDLEWMEGGMLHHAQRIREGTGLYGPPSIEFIPYLYTPLYPSLVALLGGAFGVTYGVGRAISIFALLAIALTAALQITAKRHHHPHRALPWAGTALGLGLFAAAYPITDGWYDIVRADSLFLALITVGIGALPRWARTGSGLAGHAQVAASGAILALAFFCKQTGFFYVALGGAMVLVLAWRRLPAFILAAGLLALGGTLIFQRVSNGWFWTYISEIHRSHDFNMDRFWKSFANILWQCKGENYNHPVLGAPITVIVCAGLAMVGATYWRTRTLPPQTRPLLIWSTVFGVSVIVGAIGWGTEFAHFNAYMPAFLHGGLAAGAAIPAIFSCTRILIGSHRRREMIAMIAAATAALPLALVCITARWAPSRFIPTTDDVAAGDRLIARLSDLKEPIWMPSHPWYVYMAGKQPLVHRMGIKDVTARAPRVVEGLDDWLDHKKLNAIVLDDADLHNREHLGALLRNYRSALKLPANERPRVFTGARVVPDTIWVPMIAATPPAGAKSLFDFESVAWEGWKTDGAAWGKGPVRIALPGEGLVTGATGVGYATSMHDNEAAIGRLRSPMFMLDAPRLTVRLGGGTDVTKLRVELWVDNLLVDRVGVPPPGGTTLQTVTMSIPPERLGHAASIVLVDDSPTAHLIVDDIWAWPEASGP